MWGVGGDLRKVCLTHSPPALPPAHPPARLPACPPALPPASLPACPPACLPACLPACPPACLPACPPARLPAYPPISAYLLTPTGTPPHLLMQLPHRAHSLHAGPTQLPQSRTAISTTVRDNATRVGAAQLHTQRLEGGRTVGAGAVCAWGRAMCNCTREWACANA